MIVHLRFPLPRHPGKLRGISWANREEVVAFLTAEKGAVGNPVADMLLGVHIWVEHCPLLWRAMSATVVSCVRPRKRCPYALPTPYPERQRYTVVSHQQVSGR